MLHIDADFVRAVAEDAEQRPSRDLVSDSPLIHDPVLTREIHAAWIARAASPCRSKQTSTSSASSDTVSAVVDEQVPGSVPEARRVRVAMMLQTNCRVKVSDDDRPSR